MSTPTMNFDPTLHATATGTGTNGGTTAGPVTTQPTASTGLSGTAPIVAGGGVKSTAGTGSLASFNGFLKTAGRVAGVVLSEIVKFVVPMAQVAAVADPAAAPALAAFTTSLQLVQTAVVSAQQRWAGEGSAANTQKLADVLATVEQPVVLMFAQAGLSVDSAYVTNLINGVVAILNAQPAVVLQGVTTK